MKNEHYTSDLELVGACSFLRSGAIMNEKRINQMLDGGEVLLKFEIKNRQQAEYIWALWGHHSDEIPRLKAMTFKVSYKRRFYSMLHRIASNLEQWLRGKLND